MSRRRIATPCRPRTARALGAPVTCEGRMSLFHRASGFLAALDYSGYDCASNRVCGLDSPLLGVRDTVERRNRGARSPLTFFNTPAERV
jgi:hypothetical protein